MCGGGGEEGEGRGVTRFSAQGGEDGMQLIMLLPQVLCVRGGGGGGERGQGSVHTAGLQLIPLLLHVLWGKQIRRLLEAQDGFNGCIQKPSSCKNLPGVFFG